MTVKKIIMDPECKMNYASFYILGLKELFGRKAVFSTKPFKGLPVRKQCFLFAVDTGNKLFKVAVDFHDYQIIEKEMLEWADIYAKVNLNEKSYEDLNLSPDDDCKCNKKIISIPPSFGVRVFNFYYTSKHILFLIFNFWQKKSVINYIKDTLRMYIKRAPITSYTPEPHTKNYVFFIATIWHTTTSYINVTRAHFIRACKKVKNLQFEGGFVDVGYECDYIPDLGNLMYRGRKISVKEYIRNTKKSMMVFNNPSVAYCHGWKLGEYLAMGKAILSVPLSNSLPVDLVHNRNIYFAENTPESIENAVHYLLENEELVKHLEQNATLYWESFASPKAVIKYILQHFSIKN